jgi:DNA-binding Xre family transcriptional regulator
MLRFRLPELRRERENSSGKRLTWREVSAETGIARQSLANMASQTQLCVTNTAHVEAVCRFFGCTADELIQFEPPLDTEVSCHIDSLYPNRRTAGTRKSDHDETD